MSARGAASNLPAGFHDASRIVRTAILECETEGLSQDAIATAMLTELMPRVVGSYGPTAVAVILRYVQGKLGIVEEPVIGLN